MSASTPPTTLPTAPVPTPPTTTLKPRKARRKWSPWLIAALVLGGTGAAFLLLPREAPLPEVQATQVRQGTLIRTVTGTGQARSETSHRLKFSTAGTVQEVLVAVGDEVRRGDLLARLDSSAQQREIETAQAAVRSSEADLSRARAEVERAESEVARVQGEVPKAQAEVARAQAEIERAQGQGTQAQGDIAKAQAEVARAQAEIERAQGQGTQAQGDIAKAQAEVTRAQAEVTRARSASGEAQRQQQQDISKAELALQGAQADLKAASSRLSLQQGLKQAGTVSAQDVQTAQAERDEAARKVAQAQADLSFARSSAPQSGAASVQQAEAGLKAAQAALQQARSAADTSPAVKQAQASLESAQAGVQQARSAADTSPAVKQAQASLESAQAGVQQARSAVEQARAGVQQARAGVQQAQANLDAAQLKVQNLRSALRDLELRAPADGIISAVNVAAGSPPPTDQTAVELTNPARLYLEVPFDETRSPDLAVGQPVKVEFDALPNENISGEVQKIDPVAQTSGQGSRVNARIALSSTERVRPGYTALATVTTLKKPNAALVPLAALHEENGQATVWTIRPSAEAEHVPATSTASTPSAEDATPLKGTAEQVTIKVTQRNTNDAAVTGLPAGSWVVNPYPDSEELSAGQAVQYTPQTGAELGGKQKAGQP